MQTNLDVITYTNGDLIGQVTSSTDWTNADINQVGAWCYYGFNSSSGSIYGKLYNWYAVSDTRGLAPLGWNIALSTDYNNLSTYLGGDTISGGAMKETGTSHWLNPNTGATNSSGFTALPGGFIDTDGASYNLGASAIFWCSDAFSITEPYYSALEYSVASLSTTYDTTPPSFGFSVRCIKI